MEKKREIFIRLKEISEIINLLEEIKKKEDILRDLFSQYDSLNLKEDKIFDNWSYYLEDILQKLDQVTL